MQLTLHAAHRTSHGASRLVLAMSAWSMKTRRAPSRHGRDARVYGHATTAMLDIEYTPPPGTCIACYIACYACLALSRMGSAYHNSSISIEFLLTSALAIQLFARRKTTKKNMPQLNTLYLERFIYQLCMYVTRMTDSSMFGQQGKGNQRNYITHPNLPYTGTIYLPSMYEFQHIIQKLVLMGSCRLGLYSP